MSNQQAASGFTARRALPIAAAIGLLTALLFSPAISFDFLDWDDPIYVTQNLEIADGLSSAGLRWALTSNRDGNWQPLTWLSHMTDVTLFGMNPAGHHATGVLIHAFNAALLFWLLASCTGRIWPSAIVAALFACHPLRVESVAWVSERKDVLSALFCLLTLLTYTAWSRRGGVGRYLIMMLCMTLGLAAKPMLVTLPFVLLLWDYWPLERWKARSIDTQRLVEKLPLFGLAAVSCWITLSVQRGAMAASESVSVVARLANGCVSYLRYIGKLLWPSDLSPFYPHPNLVGGRPWSTIEVSAAVLFLAVVSFLALRRAAPRFAAVGWLWFLSTLVPVIGLVQVGSQAMADRYSYLPSIGLLLLIVWGLTQAVELKPSRLMTRLAGAAAALALITYATFTWAQLTYWRDSISMLERALAVGPPTPQMLGNLGTALSMRGEKERAAEQFRAALEIDPRSHTAHAGMAELLRGAGRSGEAIEHYRQALETDPNFASVRANFGNLLLGERRFEEAIEQLDTALQLAPDLPGLELNLAQGEHALGVDFYQGGAHARDLGQAIHWIRRAADRGYPRAQFDLAVLYERGEGVARSDENAFAWFALAAERGDPTAIEWRDRAAARMTASQLSKARALMLKLQSRQQSN